MPIVVGVTFRSAGQVHYFDPAGLELHEGDAVIAPTPNGTEIGQVMTEPRDMPVHDVDLPLRAVKRKATPDDLRRDGENREREKRAFEACVARIHEHALPMKLIEAHCIFDRGRIIFYFSSEGRVDFRKLVRDLASELRTRVELHQVGVRDEARLIGGFGTCGRPLCCATFLSDLHPVAIKMAKEQNLALNPLKISGVCGRLMCCLSYEYECYRSLKAELPRMNSIIDLPQGKAKVIDVNVIKGTVTALLEDGTRVEFNPSAPAPCPGCGDEAAPCRQERIEAPRETRDRDRARRPRREASPTGRGEQPAATGRGRSGRQGQNRQPGGQTGHGSQAGQGGQAGQTAQSGQSGQGSRRPRRRRSRGRKPGTGGGTSQPQA